MRRLIPHLALATLTFGAGCAALLPTALHNSGQSTVSLEVKQCGSHPYTMASKTVSVQIPNYEVNKVVAYGLPYTNKVLIASTTGHCNSAFAVQSHFETQVEIGIANSKAGFDQLVNYDVVVHGGAIPQPYSCFWPFVQDGSCATNMSRLKSYVTDWASSHALYQVPGIRGGRLQIGEGVVGNSVVTYEAECHNIALGATQFGVDAACATNLDIFAHEFVNS
jgi:hypothetical protein